MKFFVIATRDIDQEVDQKLMDSEADHAALLYKNGFVREIYSRTDGKGAMLIAEAENEEEVMNQLSTLPFAKANLLTFQIYGAAPYRGLVRGI